MFIEGGQSNLQATAASTPTASQPAPVQMRKPEDQARIKPLCYCKFSTALTVTALTLSCVCLNFLKVMANCEWVGEDPGFECSQLTPNHVNAWLIGVGTSFVLFPLAAIASMEGL